MFYESGFILKGDTIMAEQNIVIKKVTQFAEKTNKNRVIKTITAGFMGITMISLGVSVVSILVNLPIKPWQGLLTSTGIAPVVKDSLSLTISMLGIYAVISLAYHYSKNYKGNLITGVLMATAFYFLLMPVTTTKQGITSINIAYMGSRGLFVGMLVGLLVPAMYIGLSKRNLKLKLPDSVPPMVSESMEPVFVAMIVLTFGIVLRFLFAKLPGGNAFDLLSIILADPLSHMAITPWNAILFAVICNAFWWMGIHPSILMSVMVPLQLAATTANTEAFLSGKVMPYLVFSLLTGLINVGGAGNTISLVSFYPFAKSVKYKTLGKLGIIPNLFNINEPIVFGTPVILSPFYVVPMILSSLLSGLAVWGVVALGFIPRFNPTVTSAWVLPSVLQNFLAGGWKYATLTVLAFLINCLVYFPFFKAADHVAWVEEQQDAKKENK